MEEEGESVASVLYPHYRTIPSDRLVGKYSIASLNSEKLSWYISLLRKKLCEKIALPTLPGRQYFMLVSDSFDQNFLQSSSASRSTLPTNKRALISKKWLPLFD